MEKPLPKFLVSYIEGVKKPDPTVDRRSGFLTPSMYDTKNLGGFSILIF